MTPVYYVKNGCYAEEVATFETRAMFLQCSEQLEYLAKLSGFDRVTTLIPEGLMIKERIQRKIGLCIANSIMFDERATEYNNKVNKSCTVKEMTYWNGAAYDCKKSSEESMKEADRLQNLLTPIEGEDNED